MTQPILTSEHQQIADYLYGRIEQYQQTHYQPAGGWPKSDLHVSVRQSLDKADNASQSGHTHSVDDVSDLDDHLDDVLLDYSLTTHKHSVSDINGTAASATANTLVLRDGDGNFSVNNPVSNNHPVNKRALDQSLTTKANTVHNHSVNQIVGLQTILDSKSSTTHSHNIDDVVGLRNALDNVSGTIDPEVLGKKADLVAGKIVDWQIPDLPQTKISGLVDALNSKPTLVSGTIPKPLLPSLVMNDISGLTDFVSDQTNNVKLVDGLIPRSNLPGAVFQKVIRVATVNEMLSLTTTQVDLGDTVVVSSGSGVGTYQLQLHPANNLSSWVKHASTGGVTSVNGKTNTVTLTAADVGARPTGPIAVNEVTNLTTLLNEKANVSALDGLLTQEDLVQFNSRFANQNYSYPSVDYVATNRIVTLSGQQSIDGVLVSTGKKVLLTNQSSSAQNGIWVVSSTAWYRDSSMPEATVVAKGSTIAIIDGVENKNTLWRMRNSSAATVGVDSQNWSKILSAGSSDGVAFTPGNGLQLAGDVLSVRAGNNITVNASGVSLDTTGLMRKVSGNIPGGSAVATVTHNFGTRDVYTSIYEVSTGDQVLAGITNSSVNTVTIEFASAPSTNQYRFTVFG